MRTDGQGLGTRPHTVSGQEAPWARGGAAAGGAQGVSGESASLSSSRETPELVCVAGPQVEC